MDYKQEIWKENGQFVLSVVKKLHAHKTPFSSKMNIFISGEEKV